MATGKVTAGNRLMQIMKEGSSPAFGAWQMLPGGNVSRMLASAGYDWILVDCEHGDIDDLLMREIVRTCADCGVSPVVRIPGLDNWMVKRALDAGAHGILVPLVRTVEECKNLVKWAKFPPQGVRGFGAPIAYQSFGMKNARQYLDDANDNILVFVQIETQEALDSIDEICKVEGLDGVLIGPNDLGINIGHRIQGAYGSDYPPGLESAIEKTLRSVKASGKKAGIFCADGTKGKKAASQGFDFISVCVDAALVMATADLDTAKGQ